MNTPIQADRANLTRPLVTVPRAAALLATAILATAILAAPPAQAQDLNRQIQQLRQELKTLQRHVYNSGKVPAGSVSATGGDFGKPQAARLELRLNQRDGQLRAMTGEIEQVSFRLENLARRMDALVADVDRRLQRLETGSGPALTDGATVGGPSTQSAGLAAAQATAAGQAAGQPLDGGPKVLGSVAASDLETLRRQASRDRTGQATALQGTARNPTRLAATQPAQNQPAQNQPAGTQTAGTQTAALPQGTAKEQYDHAFGLLSQANYPEAESALIAFLVKHPKDPLAGNAKYWLGETHYVRGQFRDAAVIFAEGYQQYPDSAKAPDNLLKLGKSLAALGQTGDACGTFSELLKRYPDAHPAIRQQAETEQGRIPC